MKVAFCTRIASLVLVATLAARGASAQTLTLPNGPVYEAGPDYASDVLQDPWDFTNADDIAPDPGQVLNWTAPDPTTVRSVGTSVFLSNGWFRGVPGSDAHIGLLYRADALAINTGRSGARFPIQTDRYRKLAVKMRVTGSPNPTQLAAFWFHASILENNWPTRGGSAFLAPVIPAGTSEQVYVLDLPQASPVHAPGAAYTAEALVKGFRIDPTEGAAGGVEIDWVRLTASNNQANAALMPVSLSGCSGFQSFTITDVTGSQALISDSTGNNSDRSFNYGILPPGTYNIRAACGNGTTPAVTFVINTPPAVTVVDPDEGGNPATDYAFETRNGDSWDFEQPSDVSWPLASSNLSVDQGACAAGSPHAPCGLIPRPGGPGLLLRASSSGNIADPAIPIVNGVQVPLNSRRHHLLSFTLGIRRPYDLAVGSVARMFWGSRATPDGRSMTTSQDMRVWPGLQRYTIDLAALRTDNGGIETDCLPNCLTTLWTTRAVRFLRIDPHEFGDTPTAFDVDDVTLTAADSVAPGQTFTVRYRFDDPDAAGATYSAEIYRYRWSDLANRTLLQSIPAVAPGTLLTYQLDPVTAGMAAGTYAISVEITEHRNGFTQTSVAYSSGPLEVVSLLGGPADVTVQSPTANQGVAVPFTIQGCAFDSRQSTGGINVDDIAVNMRAISGPRAGMTISLGFPDYPGTGILQFGPLGTAVPCPGANAPYNTAGFRVADVGLGTGNYFDGGWIIDVYARSTLSGEMTRVAEIPIQIGAAGPPAPVNFQASAAGNTVTVSWEAPASAVAYYQVQGSLDPSFAALAFSVNIAAAGTYSGQLPSGLYYLRAFSRSAGGAWSLPTPTRTVAVALPTPPGPPVLVPSQVSTNPVTLNWSPGPGGSPASYTIHAGTSPGASNLAVAPMGLATAITAVAPVGTPIYVRVVAANAAGQATSNEIAFTLSPPAAPTLSPASIANRNVTLQWSSVAHAASYTVIARYPGSPAIIATLPLAATTITVPAPPGTYLVTVVASNGQGTSAESNQITVVVP